MEAVGAPRPLAENDERGGFDCGRPSLNIWFKRHGLANHQSGASRVSVIAGLTTGLVAGYVTLSAAQIGRGLAPKTLQRNQPDPLPVTLLGQLAVDIRFQRQGIAVSLLYFALRTALAASRDIGSIGVITHPLDDGVREFYAKWGFESMPLDPGGAMFVKMAAVQKYLGGI